MKLIYTGQDRILIDRIKQALHQNGIPCFIRNESPIGQAAGELPPLVCWPEIYVKDEPTYQFAKPLVDALMPKTRATALKWICPKCSELIEAQFSICWSCQVDPQAS